MALSDQAKVTITDDEDGYRSVVSDTGTYGTFEMRFYRGFVSGVALWPDGVGPDSPSITLYVAKDVYKLPDGHQTPDPDSTFDISGGTYALGVALAIDNRPDTAEQTIQRVGMILKQTALPAEGGDGVQVTADNGDKVEKLVVQRGPKTGSPRGAGEYGDGDPIGKAATIVIGEDAITCPPICGTDGGPGPDGGSQPGGGTAGGSPNRMSF